MTWAKHSAWTVWLLMIFLGCKASSAAPAATNLSATAARDSSATEPYVRISGSDSNLVQLQVAARAFLPTNGPGPVIWLTAVSHIGDSNYYAALQKQLAQRTLVLYEGVSAAEDGAAPRRSRMHQAPVETSSNAPSESVSTTAGSLQSSLAAALGLVFQLDVIDYERPNFRNSDLSVAELRSLLVRSRNRSNDEGQGAPGAGGESFENLLALMQGDSWLSSVLQFGLRMLGGSPKLQALGRLTLIDLLGEIKGDPGQFGALPPDMKQLLEVLLQKRNQKVLADLKARLRTARTEDTVAVFYGAGHMPDLEQRLAAELHYYPSGQLWLNAFSVDLKRAGVTPEEREFVRNIVSWQLKQLK